MSLKESEASKNSFKNEVAVLAYLRDFESHYIGKYYFPLNRNSFKNQDVLFMKSYFHNLKYICSKSKNLSVKEGLSLVYKISKGLCFLSSKGVVHRDLKHTNVVVDLYFNPHIIDFGSAAPAWNTERFKVHDLRCTYFNIQC